MTLTSDLILGHISPIFFEYPWDWDSGQFGFRLSTSPELPTIDCIRASLHGFFEIEMDHVRFHPRSFSQMFTRQICFRHCYLADWIIQMSSILRTLRFTFRWAMIYILWDLPFEIHRQSSFSDIEGSFSLDFSEVCHDASVSDLLISADDWFTGCFGSASTLDTGAYFPSWFQ